MSLVTKGIGLAKKIKHRFDAQRRAAAVVYLSPVRRIERVKTTQRICAMTFDDGPCLLPPQPGSGTIGLTEHLAQVLERHGAKGTFDVVGDTSQNYPDVAGKEGSAQWGGVSYDHYPDFQKDQMGGAYHCPELIDRLLSAGHEITSHTYAHVLFGRKNLVYGARHYLGDLDAVVSDLQKLDDLMKTVHHNQIRLARPPHYVDTISRGINAYDAYALMGYQYMAASFDGAGWLPLATYEAEVEAMVTPMRQALSQQEDIFCGQIIFQKDGFNMARRTPVADGLELQLALLDKYGYQVLTVSELLSRAMFYDIDPTHPLYDAASMLVQNGYCAAYRDNTIRPQQDPMAMEIAMVLFGKDGVKRRIDMIRGAAGMPRGLNCNAMHPYSGALALANEAGVSSELLTSHTKMTPEVLRVLCSARFGKSTPAVHTFDSAPNRTECYNYIAEQLS